MMARAVSCGTRVAGVLMFCGFPLAIRPMMASASGRRKTPVQGPRSGLAILGAARKGPALAHRSPSGPGRQRRLPRPSQGRLRLFLHRDVGAFLLLRDEGAAAALPA